MKILIVDNNIDRECWGAKEFRAHASQIAGAVISTRRGPQEDFPNRLTSFDRLVITGSKTSILKEEPWTARLEQLILNAVETGKPVLGVCYGHQAIARALGGKQAVRKSKTPEFGWCKIDQVNSSSRLFKNVPSTFYSFGAHFEEVSLLPKGTLLLASSKQCAIQAFELSDRPVFGIQFHPEKNLLDAKQTFAERKKEGKPNTLLNPEKSRSLYNPKIGETLFRNFFTL